VTTSYKVTEIFQSVQGEGLHVGLSCNFIRLAGCPVNCSFCDTDKEKKFETTEYGILQALNPLLDHVVLTGGEPTAQPIGPLCIALRRRGYKIHLETSGWGGIPRSLVDFVALSPKKETYASIQSWDNDTVDEVKWLVPTFTPDDIIWALADVHWLQPVNFKTTIDKMNLETCLELLQDTVVPIGKSLRLSVQLHKLIGVR